MTLLDFFIHCYNSITPFQAAILLSISFLYILRLFLIDLDIPPGPRGFPLIGYWPFLKADTCHKQLKELGNKYGDVYSLRISGTLFIHLGSVKAIKEAHLTKSDCFESRFSEQGVLSSAFNEGLILLNGEAWKVVRKFFVMKFKEYGMNAVRENTSCSFYDSLRETVEELHSMKGRPIKIIDLATSKCMTALRRIIFNDSGISTEELQEITEEYGVVVTGLTSTNFLLMGKFAKYCIFPLMSNYRSFQKSNKRIEEILLKVVDRHKAEFDEKQVSDLIDSFLKEREDRRNRGDPTAAYFTDKVLVSSLGQFVTDGILTVGMMISIYLSTLVEYPDEQDKIYQEILDVVGSDRLPTIEDKSNLPYTNAFINEVLRYSDFFPLYPSLKCTKETTVGGYKIPEDAVTLVNLYAIHRNPENYENPDEFNPSRFLSTPRPELPMLFGIGKRICIGEAFSMIETFLLLTTIVQNFHLAYPEGTQTTNTMFWSTEKVDICAIPRSHK